jgi:hypothetical protein
MNYCRVTDAAASGISYAHGVKTKYEKLRGKFLWEGGKKKLTTAIMMTPWNIWFQVKLFVDQLCLLLYDKLA